MNIAKRIATVLLSSLLVLVIIIMLFNLFLGIRYSDFYRNSVSVGDVAGLEDGLVQQGLDYIEECGVLLTSGYMKDGSASRIYVNVNGKEFHTALLKENGEEYTGHAGGIAHFANYLYVSSSTGVEVFSLTDILEGKESTRRLGSVALMNNTSWLTVYDGRLYAGSFAEVGDEVTRYGAEEQYIIENPNLPGDVNCSVISIYDLSEDGGSYGIMNAAPAGVISSTSNVQGGTFDGEGNLILSTSWGAKSSRFYVYAKSFIGTADGTMNVGGTAVPLYFLGEDSLTRTIVAPPMAEEIVVIEDRLYIMNESASRKYLFGNFMGGRELYAYDLTA